MRPETMALLFAKVGPPPGLSLPAASIHDATLLHRHMAGYLQACLAQQVAAQPATTVARPQGAPLSLLQALEGKPAEHDASTDAGSGHCASSDDEEDKRAQRTTLMLRNVPKALTRDLLVQFLDKSGFWSRYDFVYLPVDHTTLAGFGYAFVNFVSVRDATSFRDSFQGRLRWDLPHDQDCEIVWSEAHQGLREHVERLRNSPVMHEAVPEKYKPLLFRNGAPAPFPAPTKRIRAPRTRRAAAPQVNSFPEVDVIS